MSMIDSAVRVSLEALFDQQREKYEEYLRLQRSDFWDSFYESLNALSITEPDALLYICEKANLDYEDVVAWKEESGVEIRLLLSSFLYFDTIPEYLTDEENKQKGFYFHYFMWRNKNDKIAHHDGDWSDTITPDNFFKRRINRIDMGWSYKSLQDFFIGNILPKLTSKVGLNINLQHPTYFQAFDTLSFKVLATIVSHYMTNPEFITQNDRMYEVVTGLKDKYINCNKSIGKLRKQIYDEFLRLRVYPYIEAEWVQDEMVAMRIGESFLITLVLMCLQTQVKASLNAKLKQIVNAKAITGNYRFKWQRLCTQLSSNVDLEDLKELATLEGIPHYLFMTKNELCVELAKRFETLVDGKKRIEGQCINSTSITLTDIKDIPPEFFYAYSHNNKLYCDDIRDLMSHFDINGPTHPIDRTKISKKVVREVQMLHKALTQKVTTMDDFDQPKEIIPTQSLLSSKMTQLASKLNYPNDVSIFVSATKPSMELFVNKLVEQNIISPQDRISLRVLQNLEQYKLTLIELLLLKIKNDPHKIALPNSREPLSEIAINLSNVYNEVFF
jgi:hypothetical protein